jgi:hypothetical protein
MLMKSEDNTSSEISIDLEDSNDLLHSEEEE